MNRALSPALCLLLFAAVSAATVLAAEPGAQGNAKAAAKTTAAPSRVERARANRTAAHSTHAAVAPTPVSATSPALPARGAQPSGLMIALDPATGDAMLPSADQAADLSDQFEAMFSSSTPPTEVTLPDGSVYSYAGRRLATALFAHIGPSGQVEWSCGPSGAAHAPLGLTPIARWAVRRASPAPQTTPVIAPEQ